MIQEKKNQGSVSLCQRGCLLRLKTYSGRLMGVWLVPHVLSHSSGSLSRKARMTPEPLHAVLYPRLLPMIQIFAKGTSRSCKVSRGQGSEVPQHFSRSRCSKQITKWAQTLALGKSTPPLLIRSLTGHLLCHWPCTRLHLFLTGGAAKPGLLEIHYVTLSKLLNFLIYF